MNKNQSVETVEVVETIVPEVVEEVKEAPAKKSSDPLDTYRKEAETKIAEMNKAIEANDMRAYARAEAALKEIEKDYADTSAKVLMDALKKQADPILASLKNHEYTILKHDMKKDDNGAVIGVASNKEKTRVLPLKKLTTYLELSNIWAFKAEKAGKLLCIRAAQELGKSTEYINQMKKDYAIDKVADHEDLGSVPTTTNKIKEMLQKVLDAIPLTAETRENTKVFARSQDVAFLVASFVKPSRKELTVEFAKPELIHSKIYEVLQSIVLGKEYEIDYRKAK